MTKPTRNRPEAADDISSRLSSGKAFADLSGWTKLSVSGAEALRWLDSLCSVSVAELAPGRAIPDVPLAREGRSLGTFAIAIAGASVLLIQEPARSSSTLGLLSADARAWDVDVEDRTENLALVSFPGREMAPNAPGTAFYAPSCLGTGVDLVALSEDRRFVLSSLAKAFSLASPQELESWRRGAVPRSQAP
ncbi:MAG TPA: hypothetical protein VFS38_06515 [Actinomycetota bacterium]|nr:hypothetical protein [Actinomycetota bacterium]